MKTAIVITALLLSTPAVAMDWRRIPENIASPNVEWAPIAVSKYNWTPPTPEQIKQAAHTATGYWGQSHYDPKPWPDKPPTPR